MAVAILMGTAERTVAYPVTFEFAGEVESFSDFSGLMGDAVEVGTPFSGSYTFESTTPDSRTDSEVEGFYDQAILSFSGEIGGIPFGADHPVSSGVRVRNDIVTTGFDFYEVGATVDFLGLTGPIIGLSLADSAASILTDDGLPVIAPSLEMSTDSGFMIATPQELGEHVFVIGSLTLFVPEPGTLAMLSLGAIAILRRRR